MFYGVVRNIGFEMLMVIHWKERDVRYGRYEMRMFRFESSDDMWGIIYVIMLYESRMTFKG